MQRVPTNFPPLRSYTLTREPGLLLAPGPMPIGFRRGREQRELPDEVPEGVVAPDLCVAWVAQLARDRTQPLPLRLRTVVRWRGDAAYREEFRERVGKLEAQLQQQFTAVLTQLCQNGALTEAEKGVLRPEFRIEIDDQRPNRHRPLPVIAVPH